MKLTAPPIDGRRRCVNPAEIYQAAPGARLYVKVDVDEDAGTQLWLMVDKVSTGTGNLTVWAETDAGIRTNTEKNMDMESIITVIGSAFAALATLNAVIGMTEHERAADMEQAGDIEPLTRKHLFFRR